MYYCGRSCFPRLGSDNRFVVFWCLVDNFIPLSNCRVNRHTYHCSGTLCLGMVVLNVTCPCYWCWGEVCYHRVSTVYRYSVSLPYWVRNTCNSGSGAWLVQRSNRRLSHHPSLDVPFINLDLDCSS